MFQSSIFDLKQQEENSPFPNLAGFPCSGILFFKNNRKEKKIKKKPTVGKPEAATQIMIIPVKV
jgi:hypothetical protein